MPRAQALAQYLVNLNVWTHNILTLVARRRAGLSAAGRSLCDVRTACDHARAPWALVSTGVVAYSCAVALALPFFSTLVGLMSSVTYLTCAYTLPVRGPAARGRGMSDCACRGCGGLASAGAQRPAARFRCHLA